MEGEAADAVFGPGAKQHTGRAGKLNLSAGRASLGIRRSSTEPGLATANNRVAAAAGTEQADTAAISSGRRRGQRRR